MTKREMQIKVNREVMSNWTRRKMNMTLDELWSTFDADVKEIEEECELEGYPSRGSNFDLLYEQLVKLYHEREQYCSDYEEQEDE